jgi:hypothetical protein
MSKRPPGRPPLDATDPSVHIGVTLPTKQFDALCARAQDAAITVPEVIRRLIADSTTEKKSLK